MSTWNYFHRPARLAFHDLTTQIRPPPNLRSLLGLGLKFIPNPRKNTPWSAFLKTTLPKMRRSIHLKTFFATRHTGTDLPDRNPSLSQTSAPPTQTTPATDDPTDDTPNADEALTDDYNMRMHVPSKWIPPIPMPRQLVQRLDTFDNALEHEVTPQRCRSNLRPHQRLALKRIQDSPDLLVVQCDKNLGPAVIERTRYIHFAHRDHLSDNRTYQRLSSAQVISFEQRIERAFDKWLTKFSQNLNPFEKKFLRHHRMHYQHAFSTFYITFKVHKSPLKTRPIVSTSGTLLYALGIYIDDKLQKAAQLQRSYFKDTFALRRELANLHLPPNALLFTADATSMYTNIPTVRALRLIGEYLTRKQFAGIPVTCVMKALKIVMKNNVFKFGDTYWLQKTGTAMGTPPAPPWAILYYAVFEDVFLPEFSDSLLLYRRFIDDVFGIFLVDPSQPDRFQELINAMNHRKCQLEWIVQPLSRSVDFMDLRISLNGTQLTTTLFEKDHCLHLYIPPISCHPPGLLPGMVHGGIFRIFQLCSDPTDQIRRTLDLFRNLQYRGYQSRVLKPLFKKAIDRATDYSGPLSPEAKRAKMKRSVLFHIRYHPRNLPSQRIQELWTRHICQPPFPAKPLWKLRNHHFKKIEIDNLIVAYSRPLNLGNILSSRDLDNTHGPPVSSLLE